VTWYEHQAGIHRYFERQAAHYACDPLTRWLGSHELAALAALTPPATQPGLTPALDFGCGTGRASGVLLRRGYRVTGYDLSPAMLGQADRSLGQQPRPTLTADREAIPGPWPLIVAMGVLDYYADSAPLWREWRDLLSPAGELVVTAPNAGSPLGWLYTFFCRFTACPTYAATADELAAVARQVGLEITGRRSFGHTLVLRLRPGGDRPAGSLIEFSENSHRPVI
jgi:SAM-dependent methyltransferase